MPERLPEEFGHLDVLVDATYESWSAIQSPESRLEWLHLRFFDRAFNIVKGVKILLEFLDSIRGRARDDASRAAV